MRLLLLVVFPALLGALSVINVLPRRNFLPESVFQKLASDDPPDMTQDLTTFKEFVPFYVNLFKEAMTKKTRETFLAHMNYVDKEMLFHECHAVQYENYGAFANWFQQFVTYHDDPIVEITSQRQTGNDQGEMILNVDVQAQFKYRQNFDMKVAALNDKKLGWKVLIVDRTLGCR